MVEIIVLIFTSRKFTELCKERGMKSTRFIITFILCYLLLIYGTLLLGFLLMDLFNNAIYILIPLLIGVGLLIVIYNLIVKKIKSYPIKNNEINNIGKE